MISTYGNMAVLVSMLARKHFLTNLQSEKTKRKIRENNEHLLLRPFTSTMMKSNKKLKKHQNMKMNWQPKSNDECGVYERYETLYELI